MSVVASKRKMSKTEFYDCALRLNGELVKLILRNFGVKSVNRNLKAFTYSAKMSAIDADVFKKLCEKYHIDIECSYPLFILEHYRNCMLDIILRLRDNTVIANTIRDVSSEAEFNYRL